MKMSEEQTLRVLLPFFDDTTLIFASRMHRACQESGYQSEIVQILTKKPDTISERQLDLYLRRERPQRLSYEVVSPCYLSQFDAIVMSKVMPPFEELLSDTAYRSATRRPCYVVFYPGLELTPALGFARRRVCDVIFAPSKPLMRLLKDRYIPDQDTIVTYGHPFFLMPEAAPPHRDQHRRPVYFFAQAISPATLRGRIHVLRLLIALAERNPARSVVVKLRHLIGENERHAHREMFSYESLISDLGEARPKNLLIESGRIDESLSQAGCCVTCTSTSAMDAISAGIPTFVYLDYPEFWLDPLREPMKLEFTGSGIIAPLQKIIRLDSTAPSAEWLEDRFRSNALFSELWQYVTHFHASRGRQISGRQPAY